MALVIPVALDADSGGEVVEVGKPPRQVVLAACGLALNDIRPSDELLGFAGALLSAGSSTVVVAVNNVGELAARRAMEDSTERWRTDRARQPHWQTRSLAIHCGTHSHPSNMDG